MKKNTALKMISITASVLLLGSGCLQLNETVKKRVTVSEQKTYELIPQISHGNFGDSTEIFEISEATEQTMYTNNAVGFSIKIPHNPKWGSQSYLIASYDEIDDGGKYPTLKFGATPIWAGKTWDRQYALSISDVKPIDQRLSELSAYSDVKQNDFNGYKIIEYHDYGLCAYASVDLFTEKHIFTLTTDAVCPTVDINDLYKILETLELK